MITMKCSKPNNEVTAIFLLFLEMQCPLVATSSKMDSRCGVFIDDVDLMLPRNISLLL